MALIEIVPRDFSANASGTADDKNNSLRHVHFSFWDPIMFA
jgi:hypothetical protein